MTTVTPTIFPFSSHSYSDDLYRKVQDSYPSSESQTYTITEINDAVFNVDVSAIDETKSNEVTISANDYLEFESFLNSINFQETGVNTTGRIDIEDDIEKIDDNENATDNIGDFLTEVRNNGTNRIDDGKSVSSKNLPLNHDTKDGDNSGNNIRTETILDSARHGNLNDLIGDDELLTGKETSVNNIDDGDGKIQDIGDLLNFPSSSSVLLSEGDTARALNKPDTDGLAENIIRPFNTTEDYVDNVTTIGMAVNEVDNEVHTRTTVLPTNITGIVTIVTSLARQNQEMNATEDACSTFSTIDLKIVLDNTSNAMEELVFSSAISESRSHNRSLERTSLSDITTENNIKNIHKGEGSNNQDVAEATDVRVYTVKPHENTPETENCQSKTHFKRLSNRIQNTLGKLGKLVVAQGIHYSSPGGYCYEANETTENNEDIIKPASVNNTVATLKYPTNWSINNAWAREIKRKIEFSTIKVRRTDQIRSKNESKHTATSSPETRIHLLENGHKSDVRTEKIRVSKLLSRVPNPQRNIKKILGRQIGLKPPVNLLGTQGRARAFGVAQNNLVYNRKNRANVKISNSTPLENLKGIKSSNTTSAHPSTIQWTENVTHHQTNEQTKSSNTQEMGFEKLTHGKRNGRLFKHETERMKSTSKRILLDISDFDYSDPYKSSKGGLESKTAKSKKRYNERIKKNPIVWILNENDIKENTVENRIEKLVTDNQKRDEVCEDKGIKELSMQYQSNIYFDTKEILPTNYNGPHNGSNERNHITEELVNKQSNNSTDNTAGISFSTSHDNNKDLNQQQYRTISEENYPVQTSTTVETLVMTNAAENENIHDSSYSINKIEEIHRRYCSNNIGDIAETRKGNRNNHENSDTNAKENIDYQENVNTNTKNNEDQENRNNNPNENIDNNENVNINAQENVIIENYAREHTNANDQEDSTEIETEGQQSTGTGAPQDETIPNDETKLKEYNREAAFNFIGPPGPVQYLANNRFFLGLRSSTTKEAEIKNIKEIGKAHIKDVLQKILSGYLRKSIQMPMLGLARKGKLVFNSALVSILM